MKLIIENIEEIQTICSYQKCLAYDDEITNYFYNNYKFLSDNQQIILKKCAFDISSILYSEYYWSARFTEDCCKKNGYDAGLEQHHFKLIDKIEHVLGDIDVILLEKLELNDI